LQGIHSVPTRHELKGAIGVIELHQAINIHWMQPRFVEPGVWVHPFSNLVCVIPSYIIKLDDLSCVMLTMKQVVPEIN